MDNIKQFKNEAEAIEEYMVASLERETPCTSEDEAKAELLAVQIPPSMKDQFSDNAIIAAAQYIDYINANNAVNETSNNPLEEQNGGAIDSTFDKNALPKVSTNEQEVINKAIAQVATKERQEASVNSKVKRLLYKNQPLAEVLGAKTVKVHPTISDKMFDNIENNLYTKDPENVKIWEDIKAMIKDDKSLVDAELSTSKGPIVGATVAVAEATGEGENSLETKDFNKDALTSFLMFKTVFKIGTDPETQLGVRIAKIEKKQVTTTKGKDVRPSIRLSFTGQKDIKDEYVDFINEPVKIAGTDEFDTVSRQITTDMRVRIWVEKTNPTTGKKEKVLGWYKIRGTFKAPKFTRKSEYMAAFPAPVNTDFIPKEVTKEDIEASEKGLQMLLAMAANKKIKDVDKLGEDMVNIVNELSKAQSGAGQDLGI